MGSSKRRLLVSASSIPSSGWEGVRKLLKLSADRGGDGVDGLDWSLGAFQLQYPLLLVLEGTNPPSFQDPFRDSLGRTGGLRTKGLVDKLVSTMAAVTLSMSSSSEDFLAGGTSIFEETTLRFCSRRQTERVFSFSYS